MKNESKMYGPRHEGKRFVTQVVERALSFAPRNEKPFDRWIDDARGEEGGLADLVVELVDGFGMSTGDLARSLDGAGAEADIADALAKGCDIAGALRSAYESAFERSIREEVANRFGGWR